jgi:hypothetical protein
VSGFLPNVKATDDSSSVRQQDAEEGERQTNRENGANRRCSTCPTKFGALATKVKFGRHTERRNQQGQLAVKRRKQCQVHEQSSVLAVKNRPEGTLTASERQEDEKIGMKNDEGE